MVIITGASGFLGRHLVKYLSGKGVACRALYHTHEPTPELKALPGIEWMQCDLLDIYDTERALEGITDVYHCAAIVSFNPRRRREMLHFNTESTANVVNQCIESGIRKMVYVSSVAALGRTGDADKEINEDAEWGESRYNSAYAISKYIAENEVWRGIGEGLDAVIVNPGIITGPGQLPGSMTRMMKLVHSEFPFYTNGVTSWVDVGDVVQLMTALMASEVTAERFIISGGNFSFREIMNDIAGAAGKRMPRYHANHFLSGIAWRLSALQSLLTGKEPVITRETANTANIRSIYNNDKILTVFPGYTYTAIERSVTEMVRSYADSVKK